MSSTITATHPAHVAGVTRPCAFGAGYVWRASSVRVDASIKQARLMNTPARRPLESPT